MDIRICAAPDCGNEFEARNSVHRFCTTKCQTKTLFSDKKQTILSSQKSKRASSKLEWVEPLDSYEKPCTKCGKLKNWREFNKQFSNRDGLAYYCKKCESKYQKDRAKNPQVKADNKNRLLKNFFGLTLEEYKAKFDEQNGLCAICNKPEVKLHHRTGEIIALAVDHDHKTGKVRKLLCHRCNLLLGNCEEDIDILKAMIAYLTQFQTESVF